MSQKVYSNGSAFPALKDGVLRIYSMRFCPYALRTRLVLAHKGIPHEVVNIHLKNKPDWFLQRTSIGLVPVLEKDGLSICESTATSEWLDDMYPEKKLQPSDPTRKALDRVLLEYFGNISSVLYKLRFSNENKEKNEQDLQKHLKFYENELAKREGPFFGGPEPAMIDFYLWPHLEKLCIFRPDDNPMIALPKMNAWSKSMLQVPAVKETIFDKKIWEEYYQATANGVFNYDLGLEE